MSVTATLAKIKNYFISWHTTNYTKLHAILNAVSSNQEDDDKLVSNKGIREAIDNATSGITYDDSNIRNLIQGNTTNIASHTNSIAANASAIADLQSQFNALNTSLVPTGGSLWNTSYTQDTVKERQKDNNAYIAISLYKTTTPSYGNVYLDVDSSKTHRMNLIQVGNIGYVDIYLSSCEIEIETPQSGTNELIFFKFPDAYQPVIGGYIPQTTTNQAIARFKITRHSNDNKWYFHGVFSQNTQKTQDFVAVSFAYLINNTGNDVLQQSFT